MKIRVLYFTMRARNIHEMNTATSLRAGALIILRRSSLGYVG